MLAAKEAVAALGVELHPAFHLEKCQGHELRRRKLWITRDELILRRALERLAVEKSVCWARISGSAASEVRGCWKQGPLPEIPSPRKMFDRKFCFGDARLALAAEILSSTRLAASVVVGERHISWVPLYPCALQVVGRATGKGHPRTLMSAPKVFLPIIGTYQDPQANCLVDRVAWEALKGWTLFEPFNYFRDRPDTTNILVSAFHQIMTSWY